MERHPCWENKVEFVNIRKYVASLNLFGLLCFHFKKEAQKTSASAIMMREVFVYYSTENAVMIN